MITILLIDDDISDYFFAHWPTTPAGRPFKFFFASQIEMARGSALRYQGTVGGTNTGEHHICSKKNGNGDLRFNVHFMIDGFDISKKFKLLADAVKFRDALLRVMHKQPQANPYQAPPEDKYSPDPVLNIGPRVCSFS